MNDAPIAEAQTVNLNEDASLSVVLGAADVDGDTLVYQVTLQPAHGILDGDPPDVTYTPAPNYNGIDALEFRVNDGTWDSQPAIVTFVVAPMNDAPTATADSAVIGEDSSAEINVLANDDDVDGDVLSISDFTQASMGIVEHNGEGMLTYIPFLNYHGHDSFSYTVSDGNGGFDTGLVTITIASINDAPVAGPQSRELAEDEPISIVLTAQDVDNDPLIYQINAGPSHGTLSGSAPDLIYTPEQNYHGPDTFSFTAGDGLLTSSPATISLFIIAVNDAPIADAGSDQTVSRLDRVVLNGSGSGDVDNDTLSFQWSLKSAPEGSTAVLSDPSQAAPTFIADPSGVYEIELIVNDGSLDSKPDMVKITALPRQVKVPDVVNLDLSLAQSAILETDLAVGNISTADSDVVLSDHVISQSPTGGSSVIEGSAVDLVISLGPVSPPVVYFNAGSTTINEGQATDLSWTTTGGQSAHIDNGIGSVALNDSITVTPVHTTTYTLTVTGPGGSTGKTVTISVLGIVEPQPEGSFGENYEDLVPQDATVDQYDPKRFALITGKVRDSAGAALAEVSITIHSHPEYGTVVTDEQGKYSIPVEGGGSLTVNFQKEGLIPIHRKVYVPWNDSAVVDTVVMIAQDPVSTTMTFDGNPDTVITAKSTEVADASGARAVTMVLTGDNQAYLVDENGNDVQQLNTITIRATEYTTPESMPAKLPPTSAFTFCTELRVDGAERVRFEKPVIAWVDNFLELPVGLIVPVGYYDRDKGVWVPDDNGLVVQLLDTDADGTVDALDADGNGQPDDLNGDQSYSDEVQGLSDSQRYAPGATFWRAATTHFTPSDWNYSARAEQPSSPPNPKGNAIADQSSSASTGSGSGGQAAGDSPCDKRQFGSFIEQRGRIFHEDINIPGTEMTLHYASNRVAGYKPGVFTIPASGDTVPETLVKIIVQLNVAGKNYEVELPAEANQIAEIEWDGLDNWGNPVAGTVIGHIRIGFVYNGFYTVPPNVARAFGLTGTAMLTIPARQPVVLWQDSEVSVTRGEGTLAEGWSISSHHWLSPTDTSVLFKGDGTITRNNVAVIDTYAGNGSNSSYYGGMGGPATQAQIPTPSALAMDSQGNLYIYSSHLVSFQYWRSYILKVAPSGTVTEFADLFYTRNMYGGYLATDTEGNLYYSGYLSLVSGDGGCVKKITPEGIQSDVIGTCGVGGILYNGIHVDNQGNIYAAISERNQVVKRDPSGLVTIVAGNGSHGSAGDGGLAIAAQLNQPEDVFVDDEGNLYIGEQGRVRKVDPAGVITTVAGGGSNLEPEDGSLATQAYLNSIFAVTLDSEGNLYLADWWKRCVRKVDPNGIITTVAGIPSDSDGYAGDGGAATNARMGRPQDVLVDPDGNLFIADLYYHRVRKVNPAAAVIQQAMDTADIAFAEESGVGYIMSSTGLHKKTIDIDSGIALYEFGYDEQNNLISITDQFGNPITIERDGNGVPTAVISADGIRTELTIDAHNRLTRVTYADQSYYEFEYTARRPDDIGDRAGRKPVCACL